MSARILNRLGERAERVGHVSWALRSAELRLALPFEAPTRERLEADLRRVRARLNQRGPGAAVRGPAPTPCRARLNVRVEARPP